jgi:AraC-like DNA-binding protein
VIAAAGRRLEEFALQQQISLGPLADSVGIDVADLKRSDRRINLESFMRLLHLLEIVSGDDCLGLRYALYFKQGDSGAFGFAILHAPTLREGLRIYQTYQRIVADNSHFDIVEERDEVTVSWRYARLIAYPEQYTDFRAGLLVKVLRGFLGAEWTPRRVELLRPRPRNSALHRAHFGTGVSFQTSSLNSLSFAATALDAPAGHDDPRLFEMMEAACQTALEAIDRSRDLRLQVAEHILELLPWSEANLPRIAAAMAMGERSLQRRLNDFGTNFEKLVEETRRDLSDRLLGTDTPLSEISYRCGYSNASGYSRAARGWYGMSPQAMRQRLRLPRDLA